ncbi:MAG: hypothetical protein JNM72_21090 [Deltaproteobacteria bacterium]|nr:hypothetical protein [Deltaproteobacteria bacterium]
MRRPPLVRALRALVHAQALVTLGLGLLMSCHSDLSALLNKPVWFAGLVLSLGPLAASVGALRALAPPVD